MNVIFVQFYVKLVLVRRVWRLPREKEPNSLAANRPADALKYDTIACNQIRKETLFILINFCDKGWEFEIFRACDLSERLAVGSRTLGEFQLELFFLSFGTQEKKL